HDRFFAVCERKLPLPNWALAPRTSSRYFFTHPILFTQIKLTAPVKSAPGQRAADSTDLPLNDRGRIESKVRVAVQKIYPFCRFGLRTFGDQHPLHVRL